MPDKFFTKYNPLWCNIREQNLGDNRGSVHKSLYRFRFRQTIQSTENIRLVILASDEILAYSCKQTYSGVCGGWYLIETLKLGVNHEGSVTKYVTIELYYF